MGEIFIGVLTAIALLGVSAFFCFSEGALFSLGRHQRESIKNEGGKKAELIERLLKRPGDLIVTVLFADEAVNIAYSAVVAMVVADLLMGPFSSETVTFVSLAVASPLLLIFGETVPKTLAVRFPSPIAKAVASPLSIFHDTITPLRWLIIKFSGLFIPRGAGDGKTTEGLAQDFSEEDIEALVLMGREEGVVNEIESRLADRLFRLRDTSARRIMTPNVDCLTLSDSLSFERAVYEIKKAGYSRIPLYSEDKNDITGVIYAKDLLLKSPSGNALTNYLRPPYFIPGSKDAFDLFREFRRRRIHMAIVVDEYGRFDGLVTMEDILEEIVGEIEDERSVGRDQPATKWDGGKLIAPGSYRVDDFNDIMLFPLIKFVGIEHFSQALSESAIPQKAGESETLAGFVFGKFGALPSEGQNICHGSLEFTVTKISGKRISEVTVEARSAPSGPEDKEDKS